MSKLGVQELKDFATAVAHVANAVDGVFADGKVDWRDTPRIPEMLAGLADFGEVDFEELLPEAADVDEAGRAELAAHFKAVFHVEHEQVADVIMAGFDIMFGAFAAIKDLRELAANIRARIALRALAAP